MTETTTLAVMNNQKRAADQEAPAPATAGKQLPSHADLNLLRTFLTVHRTGSFTAAAPGSACPNPR